MTILSSHCVMSCTITFDWVSVHSYKNIQEFQQYEYQHSKKYLGWNSNRVPYEFTRAVHKETELFFLNLLLYLQLNQTCLLQSTPLHSWYTAPNIFSSSGTRPGTCLVGWREGPLSNFPLSPLLSEVSNLLLRILTSGTKKSLQGPNLESRAAGGQQSSDASSEIHG